MSRLRRVKIAGRWVDAPAWALALPFEVRPMRGFRHEGWGYWRATLALLAKAAKAREFVQQRERAMCETLKASLAG